MPPRRVRRRGLARRVRSPLLLLVAVLLAAFNLRTAVASVGPVLDELSAGVGLSGTGAGLLTTLPVVSFAVLGSVTPRLASRYGERRLLCAALLLMTAGLLVRSQLAAAAPFLLLSVGALAGGAMGNVLLPVLVKRHFADRVPAVTAAYTTALAVGTTAAAALTVPIASLHPIPLHIASAASNHAPSGRAASGHAGMDWRLGLGVWALPAAVAALAWVALAWRSGARPSGEQSPRPAVHRSRKAWSLTLYFGAQSMQAYIQFGWFALYFRDQAGASPARAGVLVAVLAAFSVPVALVVPSLAGRFPDQRPLLAVLLACYLVAYVGMLASPRSGDLLWALLAGAAGGTFPLALTLIGLRTRTTEATASLSAFTQSVGYVLAGAGPLLVGVLRATTGGWTWPFVLIFADLALMAAAGWYATQPGYVEDDLALAAHPSGR